MERLWWTTWPADHLRRLSKRLWNKKLPQKVTLRLVYCPLKCFKLCSKRKIFEFLMHKWNAICRRLEILCEEKYHLNSKRKTDIPNMRSTSCAASEQRINVRYTAFLFQPTSVFTPHHGSHFFCTNTCNLSRKCSSYSRTAARGSRL